MRKTGLLAGLLVAFMLCSSAAFAYDYESGLKAAKKEDKPVVLYFFERSCYYCTKMDNDTLADREISSVIAKDFIFVRIDAQKSRDLLKRFPIAGTPSSWFLDSSGQRLFNAPGYIQKPLYLKILEYVKGRHYKEMDLGTFVKKGSVRK